MNTRFLQLLVACFLVGLATSVQVNAQSTYSQVYDLIQANCSSCHSGAAPAGQLDFALSEGALYDAMIDGDVTNPFAAGQNFKLVDPGVPQRSFLYRKVNNELYHDSVLDPAEGGVMPSYAATLADQDKELIRQWIQFGAPEFGEVIDYDVLEEYYVDGGLARLEQPEVPEDGFQLYLGSIFLEPGEEREYIYKYDLNNEEALEINKLDVVMNDQSHHFLFFKFFEGEADDEDDGLEEVTTLSSFLGGAQAISNDTKMIAGWAYSNDFTLPEGTAYTWDENTVLKYNYHIKNYSTEFILPVDLYVNVHTQEPGNALYEMQSDFYLEDAIPPPFGSFVVPAGEEVTFDWHFTGFDGASNNDTVHIWAIGSHTHQYGTDFDIYTAASNGEPLEQIYEGFYNFDYSFNQGYYDYGEPPFRVFDDFVSVRRGDGIFATASWFNTSTSDVGFGLTTDDEMYGMFIQYLVGDISGLDDIVGIDDEATEIADADAGVQWELFPNPNQGLTRLVYNLPEAADVNIAIYDMTGRLSSTVFNAQQQNGMQQLLINADALGLSDGLYVVRMQVGDETFNKRMLIAK